MAQRKKKNNKSFGVVFWIAVILLTVIVFAANRTNINTALEQSNIRDIFGSQKNEASDTESEDTLSTNEKGTEIEKALRALEDVQLGASVKQSPPSVIASAEDDTENPAEETEEDTPTEEETPAQATRYLYFIDVDSSGNIIPIRVARKTEQSSAPMSQSVRLLIAGLADEEVSAGLLNLVPGNSQLLSARIDNQVAYLNFNDQFRYNALGTEGVIAQLTQIVYSVTEFSSIQRVQILIDGQRVDYLNSESTIYIREPIGRDFLIG